jgi:hypothetical protein
MRGEERKEGSLNGERGDGVGDGSLQSHSGANPNLKTGKNRGSVLNGGEADGVALTVPLSNTSPSVLLLVWYSLPTTYIFHTRYLEFTVFGHP